MRIASSEQQYGNLFRRRNVLEREGDRIDGHCHVFSHVMYVPTGTVTVIARRDPVSDLIDTLSVPNIVTAYKRLRAEWSVAYQSPDLPDELNDMRLLQLQDPYPRVEELAERVRCLYRTFKPALEARSADVLFGAVETKADFGIDGVDFMLEIRADTHHTIIARADGTVTDCLYAHRTAQGRVVQYMTGWMPAYV
jgi:hypothetical protein